MKAIIFIIMLAIMPMVFSQGYEPVKPNTAKVDSLTFDAEKFSKSVDLTLAAYRKDSINVVAKKAKKQKDSGKNVFLQIAEYAATIITALTLLFQKK